MKLLSLFSGIGAFEKALVREHISFEICNYCEIDKYASKAYSILYGVSEELNIGDITKVEETSLSNSIEIITYGFPCTDISITGKQVGFYDESGRKTRSGLFFDALRIIKHVKPKVAIAENVKNLVSRTFEKQFSIVLNSLEESGYKNYWKVLNAKEYGIPQNRERVFIISVRNDIDKEFEFPDSVKLRHRLVDMLEEDVPEKYYVKPELAKNLNIKEIPNMFEDEIRPICLGNILREDFRSGYAYNVWDKNYISPTLTTSQGGGRVPMFVTPKIKISDIRRFTPKRMF